VFFAKFSKVKPTASHLSYDLGQGLGILCSGWVLKAVFDGVLTLLF